MHLSVVIPTYNRAGLLRRTLPALLGQQLEEHTYEVLFVSNGSSDQTSAVLSEAAVGSEGRLRFFEIAPTGGPSAPRNRGIREAAGDVVIIIDDDVEPDRDFVAAHAAFHQANPQPEFAAVGELTVPEEALSDPMSLFHSFPYDELRTLDRLRYLHFWTCNVSFKREFMMRAGMFDETFLYFEDILCGHKLEQNGMELRFLPAARGKHWHQLKPEGVAAKARFTGLWLYAFLERVPDRAAKLRFGVLDPDLPTPVILRRTLSRALFPVVDNPLSRAILTRLVAGSPRRTAISDLHYRWMFRRLMLAGYEEARRQRRPSSAPSAQWADRGES